MSVIETSTFDSSPEKYSLLLLINLVLHVFFFFLPFYWHSATNVTFITNLSHKVSGWMGVFSYEDHKEQINKNTTKTCTCREWGLIIATHSILYRAEANQSWCYGKTSPCNSHPGLISILHMPIVMSIHISCIAFCIPFQKVSIIQQSQKTW